MLNVLRPHFASELDAIDCSVALVSIDSKKRRIIFKVLILA